MLGNLGASSLSEHGEAGHAALSYRCFPKPDCKSILCGNISKCFWHDWPAVTTLASAIAWLLWHLFGKLSSQSLPAAFDRGMMWCGYGSRYQFGLKSSGMAERAVSCAVGVFSCFLKQGRGCHKICAWLLQGSCWAFPGFQYNGNEVLAAGSWSEGT